LYIQYGETQPDKSLLIFRELQRKTREAAPQLLAHGLSDYGLSLTLTFAECIKDAQDIIQVARLDGLL
jgi:hypothetical protein